MTLWQKIKAVLFREVSDLWKEAAYILVLITIGFALGIFLTLDILWENIK
uniref:Uncharacterized protein n=1 Tax=viral metagenome TaxID=1070528 RepID=A0A6M3J150_9ZZZZ